ncbi:MAG: cobaltochelatase subunit CobN [Candidatus Bathyarchaeota archaeon]|nr:cobaltochelatase subunit CobN [Candidatus Bathyarchaeum sp.]
MKIALIVLSHETSLVTMAVKNLTKKRITTIEVCPRCVDDFEDPKCLEEFINFAKNSQVAVMHIMGGRKSCKNFDRIMAAIREAKVPVFASGVQVDQELVGLSTVDKNDYQTIREYLKSGGMENIENLLLFLANCYDGKTYEVAPPKQLPLEGIYHPQFGYIKTLNEYIEKKYVAGKPTVGVMINRNPEKSGDEAYIKALVEAIERNGANAYVMFFSGIHRKAKTFRWTVENFFIKDGKTFVDVIISCPAHSLIAFMGSEPLDDLLSQLGVPILKAIATYNTFEEWNSSLLGLNFTEVAWNVAMPEFDGMIITMPIASRCVSAADKMTGSRQVSHKPIPERVDKLARLSINWAKLRHIPPEKKKVALIFHNYPPRNDNIGHAAGLDSAASAVNYLNELKQQGYKLDFVPKDGQELMDTIISGLTNDQRWASLAELAERAVDNVSGSQYAEWFSELTPKVQQKMKKQWGNPPGKLFNHKGSLLVPGTLNGNLFIGLQPTRGFIADAESVYHSPDLPPPYQYHCYYRWIRDVFKADVIIHFGKHGTMEWLPGKSVGLSESCFPDIIISDLPNVYPYLIDDPGEGTGAKRRSYACLVDYNIPVMHNADTYEDLAKIQVQLNEYYRAKISDPGKLAILRRMIMDKVVDANLDRDLDITPKEAFEDFDGFLERLHGYLNELSDTQIQDGLHIMGEPPTGLALEEFLVALTRLSNGGVPSLRESIAEMKGYNYNALLSTRGKLRADGRINGDLINDLNLLALELMEKYHAADFKQESIDRILQEVLGGISFKLQRCLLYISNFLVPALNATTDEITNILASCACEYISPGPSGAPTRGNADVLPTGRNFYSIDPRCVPSSAAWTVGVDLGDALLKRYMEEEGRYPETVAIVVWATDCMRTNGDDVAEILYLMGLKPVWEEASGRVTGIEPIPLEKLRRPRIDVTVRISGLFRDNFPNIVHLLDDAVALVASLKEKGDKNYIVKHVEAEVAERVKDGVDAKKAREEACFRIFGDMPGGYGSGVNHAIESKNWENQDDLAKIYVDWGCYVYSKKNFGLSSREQFERRLATVDLTVKNMDTREYDALQIDDTYSYHAGMDVAIKTIKGEAPRSFYGDSSDPNRVKIRSTAEEIKYCFRARLVNPKWIDGLKKHGYHGAAQFSEQMDYVLGWDATAEVIEDWMYEDLAEKFVLDKEMQEWLKTVNPYALQNMTERLLEAIQRNLWNATEEMKKELQQIYLNIDALLEEQNEKTKPKEKK